MHVTTIKSIHDLTAYEALCRERTEQCAEIIKQLRGFTPQEFKFTFAIGKATIANFNIEESEGWFVLSFFLAWHDYYKKELKRVTEMLHG